MSQSAQENSEAIDKLSHSLLEALDALAGLHPGFRPVHAKGIVCRGTFKPAAGVQNLTKAPHLKPESTDVIMRFSDFAGLPTVADNDLEHAGPRGVAIRFYMGEHVHTDIVGHSANGFPTRTGEEFLEFARAIAASGPDAPHPNAIEQFLSAHPKAQKFVQMPKPIPASFAQENFFGVNACLFTNEQNVSKFGRYQIVPVAGNNYYHDDEVSGLSKDFLFDELKERLNREPVKFNLFVQVANDDDITDDATEVWADDRKIVDFGVVTLTEVIPADDVETQRVIFDPIPRVDGIAPSLDPLIALRAAIYLMSGRRRRAAMAANSR